MAGHRRSVQGGPTRHRWDGGLFRSDTRLAPDYGLRDNDHRARPDRLPALAEVVHPEC